MTLQSLGLVCTALHFKEAIGPSLHAIQKSLLILAYSSPNAGKHSLATAAPVSRHGEVDSNLYGAVRNHRLSVMQHNPTTVVPVSYHWQAPANRREPIDFHCHAL